MQKHLNRNKDKYNPYTLDVDVKNSTYIVEFKDVNNIIHKVEVSEKVYEAFDKFELEDISQIHKIRKHIERNEVYEETLFHKSIDVSISVEEQVENKILHEELKDAINELNDVQRRRIKKYFFENKTYEEIAIEENCSKVAVKYSIDIALEKISKKIKI